MKPTSQEWRDGWREGFQAAQQRTIRAIASKWDDGAITDVLSLSSEPPTHFGEEDEAPITEREPHE